MSRLDAQQLLDHAECIASEEAVQAVLDRLADEIGSGLRDTFPLVLAVMGGAVVFAGRRLPRRRCPRGGGGRRGARGRGGAGGGGGGGRGRPGRSGGGRGGRGRD